MLFGMQPPDKDEKWYYTFLPYNVSAGSTNALIPLFITEGLKGTVAQVGLISAATSLAAVPANILWGNLSDTVQKRRPFILFGFIGMAISLMMMGLATSMADYFFANIMLGLLGAAIAPVGTVLVLESFKKEEWARRLGDYSKIGGIGWVIGLMIGVLWLMLMPIGDDPSLPMRTLFILSGVLCAISVLLGLRWVPEPAQKLERKEFHRYDLYKVNLFIHEKLRYLPQRALYIVEISGRNFRFRNFPANLKQYYLVIFLAFTGFLGFYVALPSYLNQYVGISSAGVFIVYLASAVISAISYVMAGRFVGSLGGRRVQTMAFLGRIFIFPSFFVVTLFQLDLTMVLVLICVLNAAAGFCWALFSVSADSLVAKMSFRRFRSQSMGMYNSIKGIAAIAGSVLGGMVAQFFGYLSLFLLSSMFVAAALLILLAINVEREPSEDEEPVLTSL